MLALLFGILFAGWNLIGGTGQTPEDFAYSDEGACVQSIYGYQDGRWTHWYRWIPGETTFINDIGGIHVLDPDRAYWVYCQR